jgi:hypothetical protein
MNTSAWARLSDSAAIDGKLMQHIQVVTYLEFDVSPIPSPKNNLKVLLRRVGHCRLPIKFEFKSYSAAPNTHCPSKYQN